MPKKGLYLDEKNPYQKECIDLLDACGHKQGRFLGLLVHDFLTRTGLDISKMDKKKMQDYMQFLEVQFEFGNPWMQTQPMMSPISFPVQTCYKEESNSKGPQIMDDMISSEDIADMDNALSAFGIA